MASEQSGGCHRKGGFLHFALIQHERQTSSELSRVPYPLIDQMGIENFFTFNEG